jgi:AcrR family transcriptional regulator
MVSSPPEGASSDKRARILRAALEACERSGVDRARMEEVAALARVSKGTLYRFFESKHDLFLATLLDSYEESLRIVDGSVGDEADPQKRLEGLLDGLTRVLTVLAPRMSVHFQAWGVVARDPAFQDRLYHFLRSFHVERAHELRDAIREGQERGVFRPEIDATAVAEGIMALLSGFLYRASFDPASATPGRLRASCDALLAPLAANGDAR